jgi:reversibly glycosylated polypeptide / UDP-arabinopyranose mutase
LKKFLIVPTIRKHSIENFLQSWKDIADWDCLIVVEDNPEKSFKLDCDFHYSWQEIQEDLKEDSWIISRRDSAIRCYGFYKAFQLGADYVFTLDDDCLPVNNGNFCNKHVENLESTTKWCETVLGHRTRGIPYRNQGVLKNVKFSLGLWQGNPDFDAITSLSLKSDEIELPKTRVLPHGQYFPFCGMNFAFKRDVCLLSYFPLMGENQPFKRFDDIWFGLICKKICDHLKFYIVCGEPHINHVRASDPFENLIKEAPGIKYNEKLWEIIEEINLKSFNVKDCMIEISDNLENQNDPYLKNLSKAIKIWIKLFEKV